MEFKREELQKIRIRAERAAGEFGINTSWKRAYIMLGDAANILDALMARSEEEKKAMDVQIAIEKEDNMPEVYTCVCGGQVFKIQDSNITCPACARIYTSSMLESPETFNSRIRPPEKEKE